MHLNKNPSLSDENSIFDSKIMDSSIYTLNIVFRGFDIAYCELKI